MLWLVPGLALTKSKINSGELTDKYQIFLLTYLLTCRKRLCENNRTPISAETETQTDLEATYSFGISIISFSLSFGFTFSLTCVTDVAAMQFFRRSEDVSADMAEMSAEGRGITPSPSGVDPGPVTVKELFSNPELRRPLFIACNLAVIQQFSGINAVRLIETLFNVPCTAAQRQTISDGH